jgi:acetyl-CoA carboxylase carboxyltransferase component
VRRVVVALAGPDVERRAGAVPHFTFRQGAEGFYEERVYRGVHPMMAKRLHLGRLSHFELERLPSVEDVYVLRGRARGNPRDERLFVMAEVRDLTPVRGPDGRIVQLPHLERMLLEALAGIRRVQARRAPGKRLHGNRVLLDVWPPLEFRPDELDEVVARLAPATEGLGLEAVVLQIRMPLPEGGLRDAVMEVTNPGGRGTVVSIVEPSTEPIPPLSEYEQKVIRLAQRGLTYPYELVRMLTPPSGGARTEFPPGEFTEYDLDEAGRLAPVRRPFGRNQAAVVVGLIRNFTPTHPEGIPRVLLLGDPSHELGALAEPECRRILAALDLAATMRLPLDWLALSAGARISMESGTENMDWIARVLRRLVEFTQAGGEVNVVVNGINVGAQPYWNAEATMLMHTRGILVMMPDSAMVLTGKRALDYSGGVSAEDNQGIGGYERVMGPNGEAQYFARDVGEACHLLLRHHQHTHVAPGERFPRRAPTSDPLRRDVCLHPYARDDGQGFARVGDIFSNEKNPGRKKPFDIRSVMAAVADQDHAPLERWAAWQDAETAVVWDAHLGGRPVCLLGIESRPVPRLGFVPADGPDQWTGGTLFPQSSRKLARALNAASGNRPAVVLANLSGFDGSPESLRLWQLEYGAEIGRAVVNFDGPIVFCVISRYHGGAFVVFSTGLNDDLQILALAGTYASVIGGAPAAAVVFAREVERRVAEDPRVQALEQEAARSAAGDKARLQARLEQLSRDVQAEKLGQVAEEFDAVHSVERALRVGSVQAILPPSQLRPRLIEAVERGIQAVLERQGAAAHAHESHHRERFWAGSRGWSA